MKANDLMIGDWVMVAECVADAHFIDYPDKIESIRDGLVGLESDGLETIIERIAPIPLTAEILEKNGFVKQWNESWKLNNSNLLIDEDNGLYVGISMLSLRLDYVHELQHVLRFCGIDKEIEL